jgi:hypothetical protein
MWIQTLVRLIFGNGLASGKCLTTYKHVINIAFKSCEKNTPNQRPRHLTLSILIQWYQ